MQSLFSIKCGNDNSQNEQLVATYWSLQPDIDPPVKQQFQWKYTLENGAYNRGGENVSALFQVVIFRHLL